MKTIAHRLGRAGSKIFGITGAGAHSRAAGFTLIELMIVIVILAVLLTVGLPAYQDQVTRSHRAAAKAEMLNIANLQHQFLLSNRTYASKTTLENNEYDLDPDVVPFYSYDISTVSPGTAPFFTITFTAIGTQSDDGDLTFNSEGVGTPAGKWER